MKFAKDLQIPLTRSEVSELVRQRSTRQGNKPIDFMLFCELLNHCFFTIDINTEIQKKEQEIAVLGDSALLWSTE